MNRNDEIERMTTHAQNALLCKEKKILFPYINIYLKINLNTNRKTISFKQLKWLFESQGLFKIKKI